MSLQTKSNTKLFIHNDSKTMRAARKIIKHELSIEQAENINHYDASLSNGNNYISQMGKYLLKYDYKLFLFSDLTENNWDTSQIVKETVDLYKECCEVMKANHFKATRNYRVLESYINFGIIPDSPHRKGWIVYAKEILDNIKDNRHCTHTYELIKKMVMNTEEEINKKNSLKRLDELIAIEANPIVKQCLEKAKAEALQQIAS